MSNAASNDTSVHAVFHVAQSFSSKQGDSGAPHFRSTRGRGRSSSHRDHQVAGPRYDKPHYKPHQGKPPHWMSATSCPGCGGQPQVDMTLTGKQTYVKENYMLSREHIANLDMGKNNGVIQRLRTTFAPSGHSLHGTQTGAFTERCS